MKPKVGEKGARLKYSFTRKQQPEDDVETRHWLVVFIFDLGRGM